MFLSHLIAFSSLYSCRLHLLNTVIIRRVAEDLFRSQARRGLIFAYYAIERKNESLQFSVSSSVPLHLIASSSFVVGYVNWKM